MTWAVQDVPTKNGMLTAINSAIGTAGKLSWQNSSDVELATTALNAGGNAFSVPSGGTMSMVGVPLTSTSFTTSGVAKIKIQTAGSATILAGTVALTSGGDVNLDALPTTGQQVRLDSASLGVN